MYIFIFLVQLSLRDNPLVVRFVSDMTHNPPSLLELAARVIKTNDIRYDRESIPRNLVEYLNSGHRCVNSKCKGQRLDLYKIQSSISLTTSNIHFFFDSWSAALSLSTALLHTVYVHFSLELFSHFNLVEQVETMHNNNTKNTIEIAIFIFLVIFLKDKMFIRFVTGVFFNNRVEHVKFVDFCGKYRLPLLQYLCSRKCIESRDGDEVVSGAMIRKVLLGWLLLDEILQLQDLLSFRSKEIEEYRSINDCQIQFQDLKVERKR